MKKVFFPLGLYLLMAFIGLNGQTGNSVNANNALSLGGKVGYESEYVFRGAKLAQSIVMPSVEGRYHFEQPFDLYGGVTVKKPVGRPSLNFRSEVDPYVGVMYFMPKNSLPVDLTLDAGFTYYWYTDRRGTSGRINRSREIYFGAIIDYVVSPAIYFFYDIDLGQYLIEPSVMYTRELEFIADGLSISAYAYAGLLQADAYNGNQRSGLPKHKNGYAYAGMKLDLIYQVNDFTKVSVGVRASANNDGLMPVGSTQFNANSQSRHSELFWWGAQVSFGF